MAAILAVPLLALTNLLSPPLPPVPVRSAAPTIVPPMFYSDIVRESELIAIGTVTGSTCRWDEGTIRTYVEVADLTVQKGKIRGATLRLRFDGGTVGGDTIRIADMPRLTVGKRYLLHVSGNGKHVSPIVGFYQGLFEITQIGGRDVLRNHAGLELIGIEKDRFVFRGEDETSTEHAAHTEIAPKIARIDSTFVPARKDVEAFERELVAKQSRARESLVKKPVPQLPSARTANAKSSDAASPPSTSSIVQPARSVTEDASPVVLAKAEDRGVRMTVSELLRAAANVR